MLDYIVYRNVNIQQLDGNCSVNSSYISSDIEASFLESLSSEISIANSPSSFLDSTLDSTLTFNEDYDDHENDELAIPVVVNVNFKVLNSTQPSWYEHYHHPAGKRPPIRININRDNKIVQSVNLPIVSVSNLRSLMPKINHFKQDMLERDISLALLSEVWEKSQSKKHKFEIEKICQMDGLKYISTPRVSTKRGGGAAIVVNLKRFSLEKLDVQIPYQLEVVWGLLKPKTQTYSQIKQILVCAFYSPPNSRKNTKLLDHLISTFHNLLTKYPNAGIILGGDKNKLNIGPLITAIK